MREGKIIVLEGLPGAGKTTIGEYLSKKYKDFQFVESIIDNELKVKNQYYYLRSDTLKYTKARKYADKGFNVLMERSCLSTLVFNYIRDKFYGFSSYPHIKNGVDKIIQKYGPPDVYIYIKVPIELGFLRKNRRFSNSVRHLWNDKEFLLKMEERSFDYLKKIKHEKVFLVENKGIFDDFVKKIEKVIEKALNGKRT